MSGLTEHFRKEEARGGSFTSQCFLLNYIYIVIKEIKSWGHSDAYNWLSFCLIPHAMVNLSDTDFHNRYINKP